jgi:DnaA family protein
LEVGLQHIGQLSLAVNLPDDETFTSFIAKENEFIITALTAYLSGKQTSTGGFYLFGSSGVGKSHLLHACCNFMEKQGKSSLCLSLSELHELTVNILDGLESVDLVCLDDLQLIAGNFQWQQAVFDLFNRIHEAGKKIIVSGNDTVASLGITLPDLVSRMQWGLTEQIKSLSDDNRVLVMRERAKIRGIDLPEDVAKFLITRSNRDMKNLIKILDVLDKESIREQRKITIPFIKEILSI